MARADSENTVLKQAIATVQKSEGSKPKSSTKIDKIFAQTFTAKSKAAIHKDYACMLNQTDVINNNNKFYVIQIAEDKGSFYLFTRWGRVVSVFEAS